MPTKYEIRDSFVGDIQNLYNLYNSLSIHATGPESLVLAEQTLVSFTVALESFISEILVALISENPDFFLANLSEDMKKALIKVGYSHLKIQYLVYKGKRKVKAKSLRELILDDGDNLAFPETKMLREFLKSNLPRSLAFEVTPEDEIFIDILKSTRNLCAHHSQKAAKALSGLHKRHFHDIKVNELSVCKSLVQKEDITIGNLGDYIKSQNRVEYIRNYLRDMVFRWIK